jgi:NADH:ubiquinone oxidoreductase subunit F (NADH-binding)/(2Fe-2S) ferredoxin
MNFQEIQARAKKEWDALEKSRKPVIILGTGTCGRAAGAFAVLDAIDKELARLKIDATVMQVGCIGLCYAEPLMDIVKPGKPRVSYGNVTPDIAGQLIEDYLVNDNPHPSLALGTIGEGTIEGIPRLFDLPMLKPQVRIVLKNCGSIDPEKIDHAIARGAYSGLARALTMTPDEVIEEVKKSGLRGRGGAGFSVATKWQLCRQQADPVKYLICNADEGDPGAFMNRLLLEGDPHAVIEGMIIGAYGIGATRGYIYCRAEKPLAIERLKLALKQAYDYGFLGKDIFGSGFSFDIELREGAGAFVCGEETALIASIEGKRGMPRPRPPFPAASGLWGKPTNINNVESWADAARILQNSAEWYAGYGTEKSKGTKTFALAGKINRTGLIEVPLGTKINDIIYSIGGGVLNGKKFKAIQIGGPSGGCLPANMLDLSVDYESLPQAGAIMGSGGMVVMDEDTCMVDVARFFLTFIQSESCGKCVPCRVGTKLMLDILERICAGEGKPEDIELLQTMGQQIKDGSLCGLGQTSPNPVLTTLRYFKDEYEAHINEKRCPSLSCTKLLSFYILPEKCQGCGICLRQCPAGAITGGKRMVHVIDQAKCIKCSTCLDACPERFGAVVKVSGQKLDVPAEPTPVKAAKPTK